MPRTARITAPGEVHHVISRFIEDRFFIRTDQERENYLRLLGRALSSSDWQCIAYAIMSSHIHLALIAGRSRASGWMLAVNPPFVKWYNELHDRSGPMFAGRAKMRITRPEHVGALIAYLHNNPVRARVVRQAANSSWTSHRAYTGRAEAPAWLRIDRGLELAGVPSGELDEWVHSRRKTKRDDPSLAEIDREARRLGAIVLGTPKLAPLEVPLYARPTAHVRPTPGRVVELTAEVLGLERGEIFDKRRGGRGPGARSAAIQIGSRFGIPMSATGDALGITPGSAARLASAKLAPSLLHAVEVIHERLLDETRSRER
jgi:hypothetical protein